MPLEITESAERALDGLEDATKHRIREELGRLVTQPDLGWSLPGYDADEVRGWRITVRENEHTYRIGVLYQIGRSYCIKVLRLKPEG